MNLTKYLLIFLLLAISSSAFPQRFFKTYDVDPQNGPAPFFQPRDLAVKPDQGFLLFGDYNAANQSKDLLAIHTNLDGDTLWARSFGSLANESGAGACPLQQGGWATMSLVFDGNSGSSLLLTLLDSAGNITLTHSYLDSLGFNTSKGFQMREGPNGDIWVATEYDANFEDDALVMRIAPNGNLIWARQIEANGYGAGYQLIPTQDGGCVVGGERGTANFGDSDIYILKLNAAGNLVWSQSFGAPGIDYFDAVSQRSNGDLLVLARYRTNGQIRQMGLVCLSANGTFKWKHKYASPTGDFTGVDVYGNADGILMMGKEFTPTTDEAFVVQLDSVGIPLANAKFRDDEYSTRVFTAEPLSDSLVVMGGFYGIGINLSRGFIWVTDILPTTTECYTRRVPLIVDSFQLVAPFSLFPETLPIQWRYNQLPCAWPRIAVM